MVHDRRDVGRVLYKIEEGGSSGPPSSLFHVERLPPELYQQDVYVGRRNARDARGLPDRLRLDPREFLARLDRQGLHGKIVEIPRNGDILQPMQLFGDRFFALDVASVLYPDLCGFDGFGSDLLLLDELPNSRLFRLL